MQPERLHFEAPITIEWLKDQTLLKTPQHVWLNVYDWILIRQQRCDPVELELRIEVLKTGQMGTLFGTPLMASPQVHEGSVIFVPNGCTEPLDFRWDRVSRYEILLED